MRISHVITPLAAVLLSVPAIQAQTVKATLNYPLGVSGVAINYAANKAYVLLPDYFALGDDAVQVLDGSSNAVLATYHVPVASAIALNVFNGTIYIAGGEPSTTNDSGTEAVVLALNPKNGAITATIPVSANAGTGVVALAVDPVNNEVFASNQTDNAITVIDGKTNTVKESVTLYGMTPQGIAVNPATGNVYAGLNDSKIAILNSKDLKISFANFGSMTAYVAVDPLDNKVFVTDGTFADPSVGVLGGGGAVKATTPVGLFPQGVAVDFFSKKVFVANEADGTISEVSAKNPFNVIKTINIAANLITVNPYHQTVYAIGAQTLTIFTECANGHDHDHDGKW